MNLLSVIRQFLTYGSMMLRLVTSDLPTLIGVTFRFSLARHPGAVLAYDFTSICTYRNHIGRMQ